VFKLDEIITEQDILILNEQCNVIVDASKDEIQTWAKEFRYPQFVCDQMKKIAS